jgi:hypothetical protein
MKIKSKSSSASNSVFSLLLIGIIYHYRFENRPDRHELGDIFIPQRSIESLQYQENEKTLLLKTKRDSRYKAQQIYAERNGARIDRSLFNGTAYFKIPHNFRPTEELTFYDYEIDYSHYKNLPKTIAQLLAPLMPYFTIKYKKFEIKGERLLIPSPTLETLISTTKLIYVAFIFDLINMPKQISIAWTKGITTTFDLRSKNLIMAPFNDLVYQVPFRDVPDHIHDLTELFYNYSND